MRSAAGSSSCCCRVARYGGNTLSHILQIEWNFTHIGMPRCQPHAHSTVGDGLCRNRDHRPASNAVIIRTSAAVSTSAPTRTVRPPAITISMVLGLAGEGAPGGGSSTGTKRYAGGGVDVGVPWAGSIAAVPGLALRWRCHRNSRPALRQHHHGAAPPATRRPPLLQLQRHGWRASAPGSSSSVCLQQYRSGEKSYLQTYCRPISSA